MWFTKKNSDHICTKNLYMTDGDLVFKKGYVYKLQKDVIGEIYSYNVMGTQHWLGESWIKYFVPIRKNRIKIKPRLN